MEISKPKRLSKTVEAKAPKSSDKDLEGQDDDQAHLSIEQPQEFDQQFSGPCLQLTPSERPVPTPAEGGDDLQTPLTDQGAISITTALRAGAALIKGSMGKNSGHIEEAAPPYEESKGPQNLLGTRAISTPYAPLFPNLREETVRLMDARRAAASAQPAVIHLPVAQRAEPPPVIHLPVTQRAEPPPYEEQLKTLTAADVQAVEQASATHEVLREFNVNRGTVSLKGLIAPGPIRVSKYIRDVLAIPADVLGAQVKYTLLRTLLMTVCKQKVGTWDLLKAMQDSFERIASASVEQMGTDSPDAALQLKCTLLASIGANDPKKPAHWLGKTGMLLGVMMSDPPGGHATAGQQMLKALGLDAKQVLGVLQSKARVENLHLKARDILQDAIKGHHFLVHGARTKFSCTGSFTPIRLVYQVAYHVYGWPGQDGDADRESRDVGVPHRVMVLAAVSYAPSLTYAQNECYASDWFFKMYNDRYPGLTLYLARPRELELNRDAGDNKAN
jgi:hypothetical protein